jgi:predicted nucleic acid-binding protein
MMQFVVDASVVVKWYVDEDEWQPARSLLASQAELHAPDLLPVECASTLWKKHRRRDLALDDASAILREILTAPIELHQCADFIDAAWRLATTIDRTIYDSLYVALAIAIDCPLVTADAKLANALSSASISLDVRHLRHWNE